MARISQLRYSLARRSLMHSSSSGEVFRGLGMFPATEIFFSDLTSTEWLWLFLAGFTIAGGVCWVVAVFNFMLMRLVRGVFSFEKALKALLGTVLLIVELASTARRLRGDLLGEWFILLLALLVRCILNQSRKLWKGSMESISMMDDGIELARCEKCPLSSV